MIRIQWRLERINFGDKKLGDTAKIYRDEARRERSLAYYGKVQVDLSLGGLTLTTIAIVMTALMLSYFFLYEIELRKPVRGQLVSKYENSLTTEFFVPETLEAPLLSRQPILIISYKADGATGMSALVDARECYKSGRKSSGLSSQDVITRISCQFEVKESDKWGETFIAQIPVKKTSIFEIVIGLGLEYV